MKVWAKLSLFCIFTKISDQGIWESHAETKRHISGCTIAVSSDWVNLFRLTARGDWRTTAFAKFNCECQEYSRNASKAFISRSCHCFFIDEINCKTLASHFLLTAKIMPTWFSLSCYYFLSFQTAIHEYHFKILESYSNTVGKTMIHGV